MNCTNCHHENPAGFAFCESCGTKLVAVCRSCGAEVSAIARFCGRCGASIGEATPSAEAPTPRERRPADYTPKHLVDKILQSKSALEGERKHVTILFADVKGSMELAEQVDPEVWHTILDRFLQILSEGVHRFEGTVNQYTGDGIMALFGAPIAHEDHAQRACYAALALRDEVARYTTEVKREHGLGFLTRMGIHSGEVVVGKIGDDLRMDYTAWGHSVGLAQRMEALAAPGTAYLSQATADRVSGYFDLGDLGEFRVKGVRDPVHVYDLVGLGSARSRFDVSRARGLTRFVGRDDDMTTLQSALAQTQAGNGQVVGVVAEAGTGKSRLCFEFIERCRADGIDVYEGHAVAHGKNIPYLPMLELFRSYYRIAEGDEGRVARDRIAGRLLLLGEKFRELLPVVFDFMGVPDPDNPAPPVDPQARQRQLYGVVRRVMQGDRDNLSISFVEDLHWMDAGSEAFLEQLVEAVMGTRALLLVNFRPEFHAAWMQKTNYRQLPLAPLGPDAIRELLDDLLGADPSITGLAETIHARTGGNPFFTEEVVQSLIESGHLEGTRGAYRLVTAIEHLSIPNTVQSILAARIDKQAEREKYVLQAAAVIGKEFPETILSQVVDLPDDDLAAALAALKSAEFVFEQSLYPAVEFAFKHPLTQEVALESQLAERRRGLHARVARAIEETDGDRLDERAALLAHHFEEASESGEAMRWHQRAAEWVGPSNPAESLRHWQRVRELGKDYDGNVDELRLLACRRVVAAGGWRSGFEEHELSALVEEGRALAERLGRPVDAATMLSGVAMVRGTRGDIAGALVALDDALDIHQPTDAPEDADLDVGLAYWNYAAGNLEFALERFDAMLRRTAGDASMGLDSSGMSYQCWAHTLAGQALASMGRISEALDRLDGVPETARSIGAGENLVWSLGALIDFCRLAGGPQLLGGVDPRKLAAEGIQIAESVGSSYTRVLADFWLGEALLLAQDWAVAEQQAQAGLARCQETQTGGETLPRFQLLLGEVRRARSDLPGAVQAMEEAVRAGDIGGTVFFAAQARSELANLLVEMGAPADAISEVIRCGREQIGQTGGHSLSPRLTEAEARLAGREGDLATCQQGLREAERAFRAMGATPHADRIAQELSS